MTDTAGRRPNRRHVLVAEDNEAHRLVLRRVLRDVGREFDMTLELVFVGDGTDLLARLESSAKRDSAVLPPDVILLDLHMPGMSGLETLRALSADTRFCFIPVIVLSSSDQPHHIDGAYARGANAYLVKLGDYESLLAQMRAFTNFWLNAARLPSGGVGGAPPG